MMARAPGLYSKIVAILKIGLPLVALGLLSGLFFIQDENDLGGEIVFSRADLAALSQGLQISNPTLTGTTADDHRFRFTAELVVPDSVPPNFAAITGLTGSIDFSDAGQVDVTSRSGRMNLAENVLELEGDIRIDGLSGYQVWSEKMLIDLTSGHVEGEEAVRGEGPLGTIEAGSFRILPSEVEDEKRHFYFDGGVHLIYNPP